MSILDRYLLKSFFAILILGSVVMAALFLVISVVDSLTWMMAQQDIPLRLIIEYYVSMLPYAMYMTTPLGALFAILITLGFMSRRNEITAVKAGGISLLRLSMPLIISSVGLCGVMYWFGDTVVPGANRKVHKLDRVMFHGGKIKNNLKTKVWYVSERNASPPSIYRIMGISPEEQKLEGFTIFELDERFLSQRMIQAESAEYKYGYWLLNKVTIHEFSPADEPKVQQTESLKLELPETAQDFLVLHREPDEMNIKRLKAHIEKIHNYGLDTKEFFVELESRRSLPMAPLILVLIAIPFAIRPGGSGGLSRSIFVAVVIGFAYYFFMAEALSLGRNGTFTPLLAAWVSNAIFSLVGLILFSAIRS